jgi:hypothetical protein
MGITIRENIMILNTRAVDDPAAESPGSSALPILRTTRPIVSTNLSKEIARLSIYLRADIWVIGGHMHAWDSKSILYMSN